MFETICFQHWGMWLIRPPPNMFYMSSCTCDDCTWCKLHQALHDYKPNKRFTRNVQRHIENLKLQQTQQTQPRARTLFVISQ